MFRIGFGLIFLVSFSFSDIFFFGVMVGRRFSFEFCGSIRLIYIVRYVV